MHRQHEATEALGAGAVDDVFSIGLPATGSMGFGQSSVNGRRRLPSPPAMITIMLSRLDGAMISSHT